MSSPSSPSPKWPKRLHLADLVPPLEACSHVALGAQGGGQWGGLGLGRGFQKLRVRARSFNRITISLPKGVSWMNLQLLCVSSLSASSCLNEITLALCEHRLLSEVAVPCMEKI